jgi:hypothetical protein
MGILKQHESSVEKVDLFIIGHTLGAPGRRNRSQPLRTLSYHNSVGHLDSSVRYRRGLLDGKIFR